MASKPRISISANFERNLEDIERFLAVLEVAQAFDAFLDELIGTVIPNLERFPEMGRPFLARLPRSVETCNAAAALAARLLKLTPDRDALREYVFKDFLLLYAKVGDDLYLLSVRHQRQLSFDLAGHWLE